MMSRIGRFAAAAMLAAAVLWDAAPAAPRRAASPGPTAGGLLSPRPRPRAPSSMLPSSISTQKELALNGRDLSDAELQRLRQGIDPITESLRALIGDLAPKLEAAKARLEQLGPKPKEDDPDESADVARDRAERESAVAELDETQRLAARHPDPGRAADGSGERPPPRRLHARAVRADLRASSAPTSGRRRRAISRATSAR